MNENIKNKVNKNFVTSLRFSKNEIETLKQQAEETCLSISDYIRHKLFSKQSAEQFDVAEKIDPKAKFACDHDREMMRFVLRTYIYTKEFVKASLSQEQYKACNDMAKEQLKEWGYE